MAQDDNTNARRALLAARIARELDPGSRGAIPIRPDQSVFPLSSVQKRLWFTEQYHPGTKVNHIRACFRLSGRLDFQAMQDALGGVIARHDVLRARFESIDGQPVQRIAPMAPFRLRRVDFLNRPEEVREQDALNAAALETEWPFDLAAGGLFRPALLRVAANDHLLVLSMHHIVFDGWSLGVLLRELGASYNTALGNRGPATVPENLQIQYADFAAWQEEWLKQEPLARQLGYWSNRLADANTRAELPLDRRRPTNQTFNGAQAVVQIPAETVERLAALARRNNATLFMALYAVFRVVLSRHSGESDMLVGTPVAGRVRSQIEPLIGCFVNTLVLRTPIVEDQTFLELLQNAKEDVLQALSNQELPFERLVEQMQPERDLSRQALVQVHFALQNAFGGSLELENLSITPVFLPTGTARYDLNLDVFPTGGALKCVFEYATDLFSAKTMQRLMGHFEHLLRAIVLHPEVKLAEVDMLTQAERAEMLLDWNQTQTAYPEYVCLHELIEAQSRRTPRAVAVECRDQFLTYAELNERATKLANHLRRLGVKVESLVGVCVERSINMMVAVLAVMKAGGAYVPLDPTFPAARLTYMVEDSGASVIVTDDDQLSRFRDYAGQVVSVAHAEAVEESMEPIPSGIRSENLAYVIYTSGSTGKPKGVMIPHRAIVNLLHSMQYEPGMTHHDAILAVTTLSFDIAALELYLPLTLGARVVIAGRETVIDARKLAAELERREITVMQATPATWNMLIESGWAGDRRLKALCGGETMTRELAEALVGRVESLWNMYGPTETTVWSVIARVHPDPDGRVPIGRPVGNTTAYVLDELGRPVPQGVTGKLYLGGNGLARGYKNLPELTAKKFIDNPLPGASGERIYDTGDLARYNADGQLECLGRMDGQVKVRGYRIELGEIESALRQHPAVRDAVAAVAGDRPDDKHLIAWILSNARSSPSSSEIQTHAGNLLPAYMVPSAFTFVDAFPMTPNGKIDRKALPAPGTMEQKAGDRQAAPETPLEEKLLRIFEQLLQVHSIGVTDNFFDLGGHSLLATRLITQIEKEIGHTIPVATLFQAPTVRHLARKLEDHTYTDAWSPLVELKRGSRFGGQPLFCVHWLDAKLVSFQRIASLLSDDRAVYGLQPEGLDGRENPPGTIKDLAALYRREIRARYPHGPYHLTGSCLGGVVAFEIAQQLMAEGEQVGLLMLIDAFMPGQPGYLHRRPHIVECVDWYVGEFLLSPVAAIKRWWHEGVARVAGHRRESGFSERVSKRLKKITLKAGSGYQPQPYPGKLTVLMCSDGASRTYEDRRLAWSAVAEGGLEIHVVPGNHGTMDHEPNIQVLAACLQRCFDSLEAPRKPKRALPVHLPMDNSVQVLQSVRDQQSELVFPSACA